MTIVFSSSPVLRSMSTSLRRIEKASPSGDDGYQPLPSGDDGYQPLEQEDRAGARSSCCAGDAAWKKAHARGMGPEVATNLRTAPVAGRTYPLKSHVFLGHRDGVVGR
jgi:hypothetical protein